MNATLPRPLPRSLQLTRLDDARAEVLRLAVGPRTSATEWTWAQTLVHAAQSIEYSLHGFPQPKPRWFQRTLGRWVFGHFARQGRMSHSLTAAIPGAPALDPATPDDVALARLLAALDAFAAWQGPLQPHFAYGPLSHAEFAQAHAMHLADHLSHFESR